MRVSPCYWPGDRAWRPGGETEIGLARAALGKVVHLITTFPSDSFLIFPDLLEKEKHSSEITGRLYGKIYSLR